MIEFEPRYLRYAIKFLIGGGFLAYILFRHFSQHRIGSNLPFSKFSNLSIGLAKIKGRSQSDTQYCAPLSGEKVDAWVVHYSYPFFVFWVTSFLRACYSRWFITSDEDNRKVLLEPDALILTSKRSYSKYVWPWSRKLRAKCKSLLTPGAKLPSLFFEAEEFVIRRGEQVQVVGEVVPGTVSMAGQECSIISNGHSSEVYVSSLDHPPSKLLLYSLTLLAVLFLGLGAFLFAGVILKIKTLTGVLIVAGVILVVLGALTYSILKPNN